MMAPLWVGVLFGMAIGALVEPWGVADPDQLIRFAMGEDRTFLACLAIASGTGAVLVFGLHAVGVPIHWGPKPLYVVGVGVGGLLFGAGWAVSGYLPGTILMALGEGRRDALWGLAGGMLGAWAWTRVSMTALGHGLVHALNVGNVIVGARWEGGTRLGGLSPGALFGLSMVYALILFWWARQRTKNGGAGDTIRMAGTRSGVGLWASAMGLGGLVALAMVGHQIFGVSTTYSWLVEAIMGPSQRTLVHSLGWEPLSDLGLFVGAFLTATLVSGRFQAWQHHVPRAWTSHFSRASRPLGAAGGAFLVLFGARMAGGCASGHMLSGGIQMALSGWLFTVAVLIAMRATARLVYPGRMPAAESPGYRLKGGYVVVLMVLGSLMTVMVAMARFQSSEAPITLGEWLTVASVPAAMLLLLSYYLGRLRARRLLSVYQERPH